MLEVSVATQEDIARIYLQGRFDGLGAQLFDQEVEARIKDEKQWLIDFTHVVYLSSAGIRSLIKYGKKIIGVGGKLILIGLNRDVKLVLETTGVLQLFGQAKEMSEALASINKEYSLDNAHSFNALNRECTWQSLAAQSCYLDIWNPLKSASLRNLTSAELMTASLEDLNMAWGIGGLGFDRVSAFEGLGSFIALEKMAGVLPADTYNQPDFMVVKDPREALMYVAAAAGFSGQPWGKLDLPPGRPVHVREIQNLIIAKLREKGQDAALLGLVVLGQIQPGSASYYHNYEDLINNRPLGRELAGPQTMMLFGLGADAGWKADEHLSIFLAQRGIKPGEEFFLGNVLLFTDLLDWNNIQMPGEVMKYCTDLELMQDVMMADENAALTEGRVWFFIPGQIRSGKEKQLQVEVKGDITFPEEWEIITRRLYTDACRVVLEPLTGGFSPGKPFRVSAYDHDNRRMLPTVLKLGPTSLIEQEIQNHQKYVHGYILNNSTTIMGQSTCGASTGMRYSFVGISGPDSNLSWLTNRFREKPVEELIPLFDKIFTRILKPWYGQPRWEMIKPYQEHNPLPLFPMIFDAAEKELGISAQAATIDCPELGLTLPNPYHFLKHEYPARQSVSQLWYTGINHGDLNMQNILLDEQDNVYIIDFSETRPRNIVSDFARLEPIFKFEMTRMGSEADLVSFLELEKALAQVNSLDEAPPFSYSGDDPTMKKAYQMICRIRKYAKTAVIFETDIIPYLLALLEWTLPIVVFINVTPFAKKAATYSAALMVDQIMRLSCRRSG
ncbi:STAS domain-containing protein [Candidatus Formimonas warabiya]|uniref:STAS domain-containing protein n=1 Tax=Formimonas warabiya TaxID=1761012 RepID=UPI0011D06283|nr:STAS domain-containing protein [Candidatus Formimonas warabiya]